MRRRIEIETRKLKSSSSHEQTPKSRVQHPWITENLPSTLSPKPHNLISRLNVTNDSVDTCIFPAESNTFISKQTCGIQTDSSVSLLSLQQENFFLKAEIQTLKSELESLKTFVEQAKVYKTIAKLKVNEEIIEMLQKQNNLIKKSLESTVPK